MNPATPLLYLAAFFALIAAGAFTLSQYFRLKDRLTYNKPKTVQPREVNISQ